MTSQHDHAVADQARLAVGRDLASWATMVHRLHVTEVPDGVDNINVDGRRVVGAIQGFGQLWRKTYRIRLAGTVVTPAEVVAVWKQRVAGFWPAGSRFHSPLGGLKPGVVVLLDQLLPGHLRAVERGDAAVRRRGVVHGHERRGGCPLPAGHLQRLQDGRGHGRPGAAADARR
jgi:hypothetical protein